MPQVFSQPSGWTVGHYITRCAPDMTGYRASVIGAANARYEVAYARRVLGAAADEAIRQRLLLEGIDELSSGRHTLTKRELGHGLRCSCAASSAARSASS